MVLLNETILNYYIPKTDFLLNFHLCSYWQHVIFHEKDH